MQQCAIRIVSSPIHPQNHYCREDSVSIALWALKSREYTFRRAAGNAGDDSQCYVDAERAYSILSSRHIDREDPDITAPLYSTSLQLQYAYCGVVFHQYVRSERVEGSPHIKKGSFRPLKKATTNRSTLIIAIGSTPADTAFHWSPCTISHLCTFAHDLFTLFQMSQIPPHST